MEARLALMIVCTMRSSSTISARKPLIFFILQEFGISKITIKRPRTAALIDEYAKPATEATVDLYRLSKKGLRRSILRSCRMDALTAIVKLYCWKRPNGTQFSRMVQQCRSRVIPRLVG